MQKAIYLALRIALSALFLTSAYTKAIDFTDFELQLLDLPLLPEAIAAPLGWVFIGLEYALGFYFLAWFHRSKVLTGVTFGLLAIFTLYLLGLLFTKGNQINCGCMGQSLAFTPIQALVKNVLTACLLWLTTWFEKQSASKPSPNWLAVAWLVFGFLSLLYSIPGLLIGQLQPLEANKNFQIELLLSEQQQPSENFHPDSSRAYLIAFLSMRCGHCKLAARKLGHLKKAMPELPIFLVLNGDAEERDSFLAEQQVQHLPSTLLGAAPFIEIAGTSVPYMAYVSSGNVLKEPEIHHLSSRYFRIKTP